jgi:quinol monooxygenase YgiN
MLVVTGSVTARPESFDQLLERSLEHVRRSRQEPGCLEHSVHVDCENSLRLVFFERWADRPALDAHFKVPATFAFARALRALAGATEGPSVYEVVLPE